MKHKGIKIGRITAIVNPGSGPVLDTTELNAQINMAHFIQDLGDGVTGCGRFPGLDEKDGRYAHYITYKGKSFLILMPGLPLEQTKFMRLPGQSAWDYPRLYVDGDSWLWCYAVEIVQEHAEDGKP